MKINLNAKLEMGALKDAPPLLVVALAVLALNALIYLFAIMPLEEAVAEADAGLQRTQNEIRSARQQISATRRDINDAKSITSRYHEVEALGFLSPQDRLARIKDMDELRLRHNIGGLQFKFGEEKVVPLASSGPRAVTFQAETVTASLEVSAEALLDRDIMAFWNDFLASIPGAYAVQSSSLKRTAGFSPELVEDLRASKPTRLVDGHLVLEILTLRQAEQTSTDTRTEAQR